MERSDLIYLQELIAPLTEKALAQALREKPDDEVTRGAYADWLEENDRKQTADMVRKGYTPGCAWFYGMPRHVFCGSVPTLVFSGMIASGLIGAYQIFSGGISCGQISPHYNPWHTASGS